MVSRLTYMVPGLSIRTYITAFSVVLLCSSLASGATFFVSNLTELNDAIKAAKPGSTIVLKDGEWRDAIIDFSSVGKDKLEISLRAQTPGKVVLTGKSRLRLNGPFLNVEGLLFRDGSSINGEPVIEFRSNNCRVSDTAIIDFNPSDPNVRYHWVYFSGHRNTLVHCRFEGKNNHNPVVANGCCEARNNSIIWCYFKDIEYVPENGREIIQVQGIGRSDQYNTDGAYCLIENNLFDHADGEGAEIISIKSNFNWIRYNTIRASRGGITLRSGYANLVQGNFIFGEGLAGTSGIRVQGPRQRVLNNYIERVVHGLLVHTGEQLFAQGCIADYLTVDFVPLKRAEAPCGYVVRYGQVSQGTFANNTFVNNSGIDIYVGINYKSGWPEQQLVRIPEENMFANNLIYKPAGGPAITTQIPDSRPPLQRLSFKPNKFFANLVFGGEVNIASPSAPDERSFILKDPLLVKLDGLWRPGPKSPAIDRGIGGLVNDDIDGQYRNRQADIGADEVSTDRATRRPLNEADVGPRWYPQAPMR